jgi:prevent-host-death family protein
MEARESIRIQARATPIGDRRSAMISMAVLPSSPLRRNPANGNMISERLVLNLKTITAMSIVTALDAKTRFGELLDRVVAGEEIVITRHDKPVARMLPEGRRSLSQVGETVDSILQLRQRIANRTKGRKGITEAEIKSAIEEGRR